MLDLHDGADPFNRRRLLSIGSLALGGLSLSMLTGARAVAGARGAANRLETGKSVVFLFQQGGPSQFETFDPKPQASLGTRTITGTIQTAIPGVHFGDSLPGLARLAHLMTVVRSFQTGNAAHNIRPIVGPESGNANLGALYSRVAGTTHPKTAMPTNVVLLPQSVCADVVPGQGRGDLLATGSLGVGNAPFVPGGAGQLLKNMRLNLPAERFQDRQALRLQLDQLGKQFENHAQFESLDSNQQQACEVLLSGSVVKALDLSTEDPRVVARYDTSRFAENSWPSAQRGKKGYYVGHAKSLGKSMLLARRLCEAGCGFVTVHRGYEGIWDMHADVTNLNIKDGMQAVGQPFDHAVSAFIQDVEERGLADQILLIVAGEMGRTPRINRTGVRDHWAKLSPLMMYGGGLTGGNVVGQSTRDGGEPLDGQLTIENLISTILHATLDVGRVRLEPDLAMISKLAEPQPFPGFA